LNHIKVSHRFLLAGSMSLVLAALPTYFFLEGELSDLSKVHSEQQGIAPVRGLLEMGRLMQQHRGLSNMLLSGNAQAETKLQEVERAISVKQAEAKVYIQSQARSDTLERWQKSKESWDLLRTQVTSKQIDAPTSFAEHSSQIRQLHRNLSFVLDDSGLALDSVSETYHLIMASGEVFYLAELQARLRGLAAGLLSKKSAAPTEISQISLLSTEIRGSRERVVDMFEKAYRSSPALKARMQSHLDAALESSNKALALTSKEVLQVSDLSYSPDEYFKAVSEAVDQQFKLADQGVILVEELLEIRSSDSLRALLLVLAAMTATMAVGTAMSLLGGRSVTRQLGGEPGDVTRWVGTIAQGDLSSGFDARGAVEGSVVHAMVGMQAGLRQMVQQVRGSAGQVVDAASQIAAGNGDLSGRTERQASALEEISASMEELLATVRQNADNARQANGLASSASDVATRGGAQMAEVVETMRAINSSANKIGDIIGVIDGIAFQTNILALNAAVEAARAGEQGRGFAVVATEVRSLAQRSAVAAKEIKTLIADSISKVEQGSSQVGRTGDTMHEMVTSVKRVTDIMGEVSASSIEQTSGIEQVNSAIVQMDEVTQQNAALVEQAAAASDSLREQATQLRELVSSFKVGQEAEFSPVQEPVHRRAAVPVRHPVTTAPARPMAAVKPAPAPRKPITTLPAVGNQPSQRQEAPASKPEPELKRPALGKTAAPQSTDDKGAKAAPAPLSDDDWEEF
jgi:methyl-accepting chemotaxis protein